ncbi:MAG: hypothetical protein O2984_03190 [Bacteroidetes bacterium]|nr:hypothetical protein [Bacteroidota bacterium]
MYHLIHYFQAFERIFNQRYGWFFINGMKAQDPEYWRRLDPFSL